MTVVMILDAYNKNRRQERLLDTASGPINQEMENVLFAQKVFEESRSYFYFVENYNNQNKYSLVCHSVDLHKDVFNCGTESLENKVLLIRKGKSGESSHGGSL